MGAEIVAIIGGIVVLFAALATIVRYDRERAIEDLKQKSPNGEWPFPSEEKKATMKSKVVVNKKTKKSNKSSR